MRLPLLDSLAALAPEAEVFSLYGSTEAEPIALRNRAAVLARWRERIRAGDGLPAGRPVGNIRLRIMADIVGEALPALEPEEFDALCLPPR